MVCCRRTCLEAEAYAGYMQGNLALYREEWSVALGNFSTAKRIYEQVNNFIINVFCNRYNL